MYRLAISECTPSLTEIWRSSGVNEIVGCYNPDEAGYYAQEQDTDEPFTQTERSEINHRCRSMPRVNCSKIDSMPF